MNYKNFKEEKETFDNQVFSYIMKRIFEDFDETDGCHENIIDGIGNVISEPDDKTQWSYTMLDQFISMTKINIGVDGLRQLFSEYQYMRDIDPLFIIRSGDIDYSSLKPVLSNIVTKVNDKTYLPEYLYHEEEFVEDEDDTMNFADHVSKSLTVATFLLYTLRGKSQLVSQDFNDIIESVECTFNMRSFGDFSTINEFCKSHGLIDNMGITDEGIRLIFSIAKEVCDSKVLSSNGKGRHNHKTNWIKLSKANF